jgi:protein-ribulosamine 3-kinase
MIPSVVLENVLGVLSCVHNEKVEVKNHHPFGSSISKTWMLETSVGDFFLKHHQNKNFPEMFEAEAKGLKFIGETKSFRVPQVIQVGEENIEESYLLLQFIHESPGSEKMFENFGRSMAELHKNTWKAFGLAHSNYIGSLRQTNAPRGDWVPFFIEERLEPMIKLAVESKHLETSLAVRFERIYKKIENMMPVEVPALLHGDLWSGNFIRQGDNVVLIDPAIYFGHREADLAMSRLFGGFDESFYGAYHEVFPLEKGWEERAEVFNLYPLLVHVNLFGDQYVTRFMNVIKKYL